MVPGHERAALGLIAALEAQTADGNRSAAKQLLLAYEDYLEAFPTNRDIMREFALLLVKRRSFDAAIPKLEALLPWDPGNRTLRRLLAYSYRKVDRCRDAVVLLKALLKERPRNEALLVELAHCLDRMGAAAYAQELLKKAMGFFPSSGTIPLALGVLLSRAKKTEKALEAFREAAARSPSDPRPLRRMEALYRNTGIDEYADRYAAEAAKLENTARGKKNPLRRH